MDKETEVERVFEFRVRMDCENNPSYPQYTNAIIVSNDREMAGQMLEAEMQSEIDTFHDNPDSVTWEETLVDVG